MRNGPLDHRPGKSLQSSYLIKLIVQLIWNKRPSEYTDAHQREGQTVQDFSDYLGFWEAMFSHPLPSAQRIEGLRTRALEEVRQEVKQCPNPPEDHNDFVIYLQMMENGMKEQKDAISRYQNSKVKSSLNWTQRTLQGSGNNKASIRRGSGSGHHTGKKSRSHNGKECTYCRKPGHREFECH